MTHSLGKQRILVLGGGYAGLVAAARAARGAGRLAEVTLIDARPAFVQRIRLHEALAGSSPKEAEYAPLLARRGIHFVQGAVESLELDGQRVTGRAAGGGRMELGWDELVIALGSATAARVPGVVEHAVRLNSPAEARKAHERVRAVAAAGGRILVIGGGLTGLESATELAERFPSLRITLATQGRVDEAYSRRGREHLRRRLQELGIERIEGVSIAGLESDRAWTLDGSALPFDLCVWCGGFEAPRLAREAGLAVDRFGRILVDETLRIPGRSNVFAVGDAAASAGPGGGPVRMSCASALPMGAHAGENVARRIRGKEPRPFPFAFVVRCISLGRRDGLVQFTEPDDAPRDRVLTRRSAVLIKELICRMTWVVVRGEVSTGLRLYHWPGDPRPGRAAEPLVESR
jgi:NADH:ubiquinone reductase (H+-translocating)